MQKIDKNFFKTIYSSPIGEIYFIHKDEILYGLYFKNQKHFPKIVNDLEIKNSDFSKKISKWLNEYFKGNNPIIDFQISFNGTEFQNKIWKSLLNIKYGKTCSYKELAMKTHNNSSLMARAVANAVGKNPISIIVPCHRIIGSNGSLTGFAGGLEKKKYLLNLEQNN